MSTPFQRPRASATRVVVFVVFAIAAVLQCRTFQPLIRSVQADDQLYFFVAERVASGIPPHVSLVDHKHQLPGLLSGAAIATGRLFGADDVMAGRTLSVAVAVLIVLGGLGLGTALTGNAVAGALTALALVGFRSLFLEAAIGFRPQLFMTCFVVLGHLAFARARPFAAGLLAAAAFLCWQPAAVVGLAMFVATLSGQNRDFRAAMRLVAGGLAAVAAYETYFLWHGVLAEQVRQSYVMAAASEGFRPPELMETIGFLTREAGRGRSPQEYLTMAMLVGFAGLAAFAVIAPEKAAAAWTRSPPWRAVILAAVGAVGFTFVDHQAYPDRFFYLPYVALTAGALTAAVIDWIRNRFIRALFIGAAVIVLARAAFPTEKMHPLAGTLAQQRAIAADFAAVAAAHDGSVWVVGRPDLLAFNRMNNWTPFGMLLDARVREYASARSGESVYRPLRDGEMPAVIFAARVSLQRHLPWLAEEYQPLEDASRWRSFHIAAYTRRAASDISRTVDASTCGRATGDVSGAALRKPTASDALVVLRAALGMRSCARCTCDTDGSGEITAADSLRLLRRSTSSEVRLLCPPCEQPD